MPFSLASPFSIRRFNFFCLQVLLTRASLLALAKSIYYMSRVDDTNNLHILIDLGFRTENQVQLTFMSPVPVVSALGHMKSGGSGDDIEQTRQ